jgi:hypothetical protein
MINEARTLLINKPSSFFTHDYCNEFISEKFTPVKLDKDASLLYSLLFGTAPDELTLNYRASQFLSLIHSDSFLYHYLLQLDPRITYDFKKWDNFSFGNHFNLSSEYLRVQANTFIGDDFSGHNVTNIDIDLTKNGNTWTIDYVSYYPKTAHKRVTTTENVITINDPVFTDYYVTIIGLNTTLNNSEKIAGTIISRPARSLSTIMDLVYDAGAHNMSLGLPDEEPYASFKEIAYGGYSPVKRLCGNLLRLIYSNKLKLNG